MLGRWPGPDGRSKTVPEFNYRCRYLHRVPTPTDCLTCQRPRCVHDGEPVDARKTRKRSVHPYLAALRASLVLHGLGDKEKGQTS